MAVNKMNGIEKTTVFENSFTFIGKTLMHSLYLSFFAFIIKNTVQMMPINIVEISYTLTIAVYASVDMFSYKSMKIQLIKLLIK